MNKVPISAETNNTRQGVLFLARAFGRLLKVLRLKGILNDLDMSYISDDIDEQEYISKLVDWRRYNL